MEVLSFDQQAEITTYRNNHPRAYSRDRNGTPDGLSRKVEWLVVDPDQQYRTVGLGKSEPLAWLDAAERDNDGDPQGFC